MSLTCLTELKNDTTKLERGIAIIKNRISRLHWELGETGKPELFLQSYYILDTDLIGVP